MLTLGIQASENPWILCTIKCYIGFQLRQTNILTKWLSYTIYILVYNLWTWIHAIHVNLEAIILNINFETIIPMYICITWLELFFIILCNFHINTMCNIISCYDLYFCTGHLKFKNTNFPLITGFANCYLQSWHRQKYIYLQHKYHLNNKSTTHGCTSVALWC